MSELGVSGEDDRPCATGTTRVQKRWMEEVETAVLKRPRVIFHRHSLVLVARHLNTSPLPDWPHVRIPLLSLWFCPSLYTYLGRCISLFLFHDIARYLGIQGTYEERTKLGSASWSQVGRSNLSSLPIPSLGKPYQTKNPMVENSPSL